MTSFFPAFSIVSKKFFKNIYIKNNNYYNKNNNTIYISFGCVQKLIYQKVLGGGETEFKRKIAGTVFPETKTINKKKIKKKL